MNKGTTIFNKNHLNQYMFLNLKTTSKEHSLTDTKKILQAELEKIINRKDDKIFRIMELKDDLMIYLVTDFKGEREWEEFIKAICGRKKIQIVSLSKLNLNPFK